MGRRVDSLQAANGRIVGAIARFDREPGKSGSIIVAKSGALAMPDVGADVMVVTARRHECRAAAPPRQLKAEPATIEFLRLLDIADAQMDVADAQPLRRRRIGCGGAIRAKLLQDRLDVELLGLH